MPEKKIEISIEGERFRAAGRQPIADGWRVLMPSVEAEEEPRGSDDDAPKEQLEQEDDPDLERRRRKMDQFAGPPGPGVAFYQKLGDYWT